MGGKVAVMLVDELPSDRKFVFYRGEAYRRILTGDHRISDSEIGCHNWAAGPRTKLLRILLTHSPNPRTFSASPVDNL